MDLYKINQLLRDVADCKNDCPVNQKEEFIEMLYKILQIHLPQFNKLINHFTTVPPQYGRPYLTIEIYDTVEEIIVVVRYILYNAAFFDTHTAYRYMELEFVNLYTPVVL